MIWMDFKHLIFYRLFIHGKKPKKSIPTHTPLRPQRRKSICGVVMAFFIAVHRRSGFPLFKRRKKVVDDLALVPGKDIYIGPFWRVHLVAVLHGEFDLTRDTLPRIT